MVHKGGLGALHVTDLLDVLQQARLCAANLSSGLAAALGAGPGNMETA
jgi:hypothetical protein